MNPRSIGRLVGRAPWRRSDLDDPDRLFDGDDTAFKRAVGGVEVYGEYGMGKSTVWVLGNTDAEVIAVETDPTWIAHVRERAGTATDRLKAVHADLGPTERHGRPVGYSRADAFPTYTEALWTRDRKPEVVLIDGRFRVCCFLTSLRRASPGTVLIFDDYVPRQIYHVCESFLPPVEACGRQAIFEVPSQVDRQALGHAIERFRYVMD